MDRCLISIWRPQPSAQHRSQVPDPSLLVLEDFLTLCFRQLHQTNRGLFPTCCIASTSPRAPILLWFRRDCIAQILFVTTVGFLESLVSLILQPFSFADDDDGASLLFMYVPLYSRLSTVTSDLPFLYLLQFYSSPTSFIVHELNRPITRRLSFTTTISLAVSISISLLKFLHLLFLYAQTKSAPTSTSTLFLSRSLISTLWILR